MLLVVVQVHTAAQTETPHLAIGALPFAGPFAVAELVEAILPHVPETVPVNIPLMEIGPDGGTARNRPVHPDRGSRNPGGALVEIVPHLAFVTAQKAFAGVTQVDASLLTGTLYELQHLAELCVGNRERRIVLGPATGKIEKMRQYFTPSAINSSLNSSSRATIGEVTHVITS